MREEVDVYGEIAVGLGESQSSSSIPLVSVSVVSHGHAGMIGHLLSDLERLSDSSFEAIITVNIPEANTVWPEYTFPTRVIHNHVPKGFGANHNAAFQQARGKYFAVVNPDIRLPVFRFEPVIELIASDGIGAVAPLVRSSDGGIEDSARRFPNLFRLARKLVSRTRRLDYVIASDPISVDWVAGMFILFRREAFASVNGFDERFFMYYEDVDICSRLRKRHWSIMLQPETSINHDAQRASHRELKHLQWHMASAARYLFTSK